MKIDIIEIATIKAIAEAILSMVEFDPSLEMYVLPEGAVFSIDKVMADRTANYLGIKMNN